MNSFRVMWKRVVVLVLLSMVGVGLAAGILWWGANAPLPVYDTLNPDQFQELGFEELDVERVASSSGLNVYDVSFNFEQTSKSEAEVSFNAFNELETGIKNRNQIAPGFYNVDGSSTVNGFPVHFQFTSFNPSDYNTNVFNTAYSTFNDLLNISQLETVDYVNEVQQNGTRMVTVTGYSDVLYDALSLQSIWEGILNQLPVSDVTTYNVNLVSRQVSYHATFNDEQERIALTAIPSPIWDTSAAYADPAGVFKEYGVQEVNVYLVPEAETNTHVISLVVEEPANKPDYVTRFEETAQQDSKVSWRNMYFTTFTSVDSSRPFWTVSPSNRVW